MIKAGLDYLLMGWLGPVGISLSTSLVYLSTSILIFRFVRSPIPRIFPEKLWADILRAMLVCVSAGAALWTFRQTSANSAALVIAGALFAVVVFSIYRWCGLLSTPFKRYQTVITQ